MAATGEIGAVPPFRRIEAGGVTLAWREVGAGPPVILLHGLGGNSASWAEQFAPLGLRNRVIAWDMPGFGASDGLAATSPRIANYAAVLDDFIEAIEVDEPAIVVGTSFGAMIAAELARARPERVCALALIHGVIGMGRLAPERRDELRRIRAAELAAMGMARYAAERNATYVGTAPLEIVARVVALAGAARVDGYLAAHGALVEGDMFGLIRDLRLPVLVVSGDRDPIAKDEDCEKVARALAQGRFVRLAGAGHYSYLERAEAFNALLAEFIASAAH